MGVTMPKEDSGCTVVRVWVSRGSRQGANCRQGFQNMNASQAAVTRTHTRTPHTPPVTYPPPPPITGGGTPTHKPQGSLVRFVQ